ncbi:MAG: hypothetical protein ABI162_05555 [Luteolibacter sp.]
MQMMIACDKTFVTHRIAEKSQSIKIHIVMNRPASDLDEIQEQLMENGFHWLRRGFDSFEDTSKDVELTVLYCAISFELFAKALVFSKQWELIFSEPGDASLKSLKNGSAKTIGLDQAGKRLGKLCQIECSKEFVKLNQLSRHRNKIVHFFHADLSNDQGRKQVALEIVGAWGALIHLLKRSEFQDLTESRSADLKQIDDQLFHLAPYLSSQAELIRSSHSSPEELDECPLCKQETYDLDVCLLCGAYEESHSDVMDGADYIHPADCPECGCEEAVFRVNPQGARCSNADCSQYFEVFGVCEWCQSSFVERFDESDDMAPEDRRNTNLTGCSNCDGWIGHLSSKD